MFICQALSFYIWFIYTQIQMLQWKEIYIDILLDRFWLFPNMQTTRISQWRVQLLGIWKAKGILDQEFSVWSCQTWYPWILGELERLVPMEVVLKGTNVFWELSSRE